MNPEPHDPARAIAAALMANQALMARRELVVTRAVRTTLACPVQWDAWTDDGRYLYLRHRHGRGSVEHHPDPDPETWTVVPPIATFEGELDCGDSDDPEHQELTELVDFARQAGLTLAPGIVVERGEPTTWAIEFPWPPGPPVIRKVRG